MELKAAVLTAWLATMMSSTQAQLVVSSFSGSVTSQEISSFNNYIADLTPASDNIGNQWAQGHSGEETKAMGLVYQIAKQTTTLNNMIRFCDAVLSQRNDLAAAPTGQHVIWTGNIAPCWPNDVTEDPIKTGGEQGDSIGHLAYCSNLILNNTSLYDETIPDGDPHKYGTTYYNRAITYLHAGDYAMQNHVLSRLLDLSNDKKMYFAKDSPYQGGDPVPWNQQMMFTYAFQNLVEAHRILQDNKTLLYQYKGIVEANLEWFFTGGGSRITTDKAGNPAYVWSYADGAQIEDSNHGSLDVEGYSRHYFDGNWGITTAQMQPFANAFIDNMNYGNKTWAGRVTGGCGTGHAACTSYIRSGYLLLAYFLPDKYTDMMSSDLSVGGKGSKSIEEFSRFLWVKHLRSQS